MLPGKRARRPERPGVRARSIFQQQFQDNLDLASRATAARRPPCSAASGRLERAAATPTPPTTSSASDEPSSTPAPARRWDQPLRAQARPHAASSSGSRAAPSASPSATRTAWTSTRASTSTRACRARSRVSFLQVTPRGAGALHALRRHRDRRRASIDEPRSTAATWRASLEVRGPTFSRVFKHAGQLLLRPLQARDRARGHLDLPLAGRRLRLHPQASTATTTSSAPTRSATRSCSASTPSARGAQRQAGALRVPELAPGPDLLRGHRRATRTSSTPTTPPPSFGPGGAARPLLARCSRACALRPTPRLSSNFDLEYDVNFRQMRSLSLSTNVNYDRGAAAGRLVARQAAAVNLDRTASCMRDTLRGSGALPAAAAPADARGLGGLRPAEQEPRPGAAAALRYDVQCCGFIVEMIQSRLQHASKERQFRFCDRARQHRLDRQLHGRRSEDAPLAASWRSAEPSDAHPGHRRRRLHRQQLRALRGARHPGLGDRSSSTS